jgi:hypothetical protein
VNLLPKPLAYTVMGLVTLVWAVNFAAQFFVEGYASDPLIHGIFMTIVGGAMALSRKSGNQSETPKPPTPPEPPQVTSGPSGGAG